MRVIWGDAEAEYFCRRDMDRTYRVEGKLEFSFLAQGCRTSLGPLWRDAPKQTSGNSGLRLRAVATPKAELDKIER
jgi:hypothetical protein